MEGDQAAKNMLVAQGNQAAGSDFIIETPQTASTQAGKAVSNFLQKGGVLPIAQTAVIEGGAAFTNFISGLIGGRGATREEINEVKKILGATYK